MLDGNNTYSGGTVLQQGTLALAQDNALGTGPLTTLGSVVAYAPGVTIDNAIIVNSSDTELNVRLGIATQAGDISELNGPRSLQKTGSGTLMLTGANTYTGATSVNQGTLQAGAANTFSPASALNVAAGATLALNNFNQTVGSLAGAGNVTLGSATLTAGGNNTSTTFSGIIGGSGGLTKVGTGTLILSGANTYTGATNVNAGALIVNGSIASSSLTTVNSGAALIGSGTVGSTVVNAGGFLVPGPVGVPGTMTVTGNLAFQSGAFYIVQVNPTTASTTNVSGTASLAGTVGAIFLPGSYLSRSYTILTAAGGLTGTFDALSTAGLPPNFGTRLNYVGNTVVLNLMARLVPPSQRHQFPPSQRHQFRPYRACRPCRSRRRCGPSQKMRSTSAERLTTSSTMAARYRRPLGRFIPSPAALSPTR